MAVLIGIAARQSIDEDRAIRIDELTDLDPQADKWAQGIAPGPIYPYSSLDIAIEVFMGAKRH